MAARYRRPGASIRRANAPNLASALPFQSVVGLFGCASPTKRVSQEAVRRAEIFGEPLTLESIMGSITTLTATSTISGVKVVATLSDDYLTSAQALACIGSRVVLSGVSLTQRSPIEGFEIIASDTDSLTWINDGVTPGSPESPAAAKFAIVPFAALEARSDNLQETSELQRDAAKVSTNGWSFLRPHVVGTDLSFPVTIGDGSAFCVEIDGVTAFTIVLLSSAAIGVTNVDEAVVSLGIGSYTALITGSTSGANLNVDEFAHYLSEAVVAYISDAVNADTGALYDECVRCVTVEAERRFVMTSALPVGGSLSLFAYHADGSTEPICAALFGPLTDGEVKAGSRVEVKRPYYLSTSAYTLDYVDLDDEQDWLANSNTDDPETDPHIVSLVTVGSEPKTSDYIEGEDYGQFPGAYPDQVDWSVLIPAQYTGTAINTSTNLLHPLVWSDADGHMTAWDTSIEATTVVVTRGNAANDGTVITVYGVDEDGEYATYQVTISAATHTSTTLFKYVYHVTSSLAAATADITVTQTDGTGVATFDTGDANTFCAIAAIDIGVEIDRLGAVDLALLNTSPSAIAAALGFSSATTRTTIAQAVAQANVTLMSLRAYGARYQSAFSSVALPVGTGIRITSPLKGEASSVAYRADSVSGAIFASAMLQLFGEGNVLVDAELGTSAGHVPAPGSTYYVDYTMVRPSTDYNNPKVFYDYSDVSADLGPATASNPLSVAAYIAFRHNAPFVVLTQVDDSASPGVPSRQAFVEALEATESTDLITDVILLTSPNCNTSPSIARVRELQLDLKDHIETQSSELVKHWRIAWGGMPTGTVLGTRDTSNSFSQRAARTLQFSPQSPGRGRFRLVAGPATRGLTIDIQQDGAGIERIGPLSSEYLAVAAAARRTSDAFGGVAQTLMNSSLIGFNTDDIDVVSKPGAVDMAASCGVMVVSYLEGEFKIVDPCTTEAGGENIDQYRFDSTMPPVDLMSRRFNVKYEALKGTVPEDADDFVVAVKDAVRTILQQAISEDPPTIAPFRDANGRTRPISMDTDIRVFFDGQSRTKLKVRRYFNLRYPVTEFDDVFSVDNNFALSLG